MRQRMGHKKKLKIYTTDNKQQFVQNDNKKEETDNQTKIVSRGQRIRRKLFTCSLPWWCKHLVYGICWFIMTLCLVLTIVKGIEYGNERCAEWIILVVISILFSLLIIEPLKVIYLLIKIEQYQL
jgi:hypothetical protein